MINKIKNLFVKEKFDYLVQVFIPNVDSMRKQLSVKAKLIRDKEDNLLYLVDIASSGKKFKELFPGENKKLFSIDELDNLKKRLKKEKAKDLSKTKSSDALNPLNKQKLEYQLEFLISKLEQERGSFAIESSGGLKNIYYIRKSSGLFPVHWDINSNKAFSPTETQAKDAFTLWKNKHENLMKNPSAGIEKITATIAAVVLVVLVIAAGYYNYYLATEATRLEQSRINAEFICQDAALKEHKEILDTNKETSNLLNRFVKEKVLTPEPELEQPNAEVIR